MLSHTIEVGVALFRRPRVGMLSGRRAGDSMLSLEAIMQNVLFSNFARSKFVGAVAPVVFGWMENGVLQVCLPLSHCVESQFDG